MTDEARTRRLWDQQNKHEGDRLGLFTAVKESIPATRVLYVGSFVDIAPSFVFDDVTYVDLDRRAARFFDDVATVDAIIGEHRADRAQWRFISADFREGLGLEPGSFDLVLSLYTGPASDTCGHFTRTGGHFLANSSHGEVGLLSLDDRFSLAAVITNRAGSYAVTRAGLDGYLIPKRPPHPSGEEVLSLGRGIAYTRSPFAYVFLRTD